MKFKSYEGNPKKPAAETEERALVQSENNQESYKLLFTPVKILINGQVLEVSACMRKKSDSNNPAKMVALIDTNKPWSFATREQLQAFAIENTHLVSTGKLVALGDIVPRERSAEFVTNKDGLSQTGTYYPDFGFNNDIDFLIIRKVE